MHGHSLVECKHNHYIFIDGDLSCSNWFFAYVSVKFEIFGLFKKNLHMYLILPTKQLSFDSFPFLRSFSIIRIEDWNTCCFDVCVSGVCVTQFMYDILGLKLYKLEQLCLERRPSAQRTFAKMMLHHMSNRSKIKQYRVTQTKWKWWRGRLPTDNHSTIPYIMHVTCSKELCKVILHHNPIWHKLLNCIVGKGRDLWGQEHTTRRRVGN